MDQPKLRLRINFDKDEFMNGYFGMFLYTYFTMKINLF